MVYTVHFYGICNGIWKTTGPNLSNLQVEDFNEEQFKSVKSFMSYNLCGNRFLILVSFIPSWVARTLFRAWYHMKWFLKLYNMSHSDERSSCLCELWRIVLFEAFQGILYWHFYGRRCNAVTNLGRQQNELFGLTFISP